MTRWWSGERESFIGVIIFSVLLEFCEATMLKKRYSSVLLTIPPSSATPNLFRQYLSGEATVEVKKKQLNQFHRNQQKTGRKSAEDLYREANIFCGCCRQEKNVSVARWLFVSLSDSSLQRDSEKKNHSSAQSHLIWIIRFLLLLLRSSKSFFFSAF